MTSYLPFLSVVEVAACDPQDCLKIVCVCVFLCSHFLMNVLMPKQMTEVFILGPYTQLNLVCSWREKSCVKKVYFEKPPMYPSSRLHNLKQNIKSLDLSFYKVTQVLEMVTFFYPIAWL